MGCLPCHPDKCYWTACTCIFQREVECSSVWCFVCWRWLGSNEPCSNTSCSSVVWTGGQYSNDSARKTHTNYDKLPKRPYWTTVCHYLFSSKLGCYCKNFHQCSGNWRQHRHPYLCLQQCC